MTGAYNDLYPVHNDSGDPLILHIAGASIPVAACPVFSKGVPLYLTTGGYQFFGNDSGLVEVAVPHGLGVPLAFVDVMPALSAGGSGVWTAQWGQYQPSDNTAFYVVFTDPSGGTFSSGVEYFFNFLALTVLAL